MANEIRLRPLFKNGITSVGTLLAAQVALSGTNMDTLPVVDATSHLMLTLDPGAVFGAPEVVMVTGHTAGGSLVNIVRAQEGTVARDHPVGTRWACAALPSDLAMVDALTLGGQPKTYFRYRGQRSMTNDVDHNEAYLNAVTINAFLAGGSYQTYNVTGGPPGLTGWGWLEVHTHIGGAHWQRQVYKDMNSASYLSVFERFCSGGDATLAASWSPWYPLQGTDRSGSMTRTSNYTSGPQNARYDFPMTSGTASNGRNALYWDGDRKLVCRFTGYYSFTAHLHSNSTMMGTHDYEINRQFVGGGEENLAQEWGSNWYGGSHSLAAAPKLLNAGDLVRLVQQDPLGTSYVHQGLGPTLYGWFHGPSA